MIDSSPTAGGIANWAEVKAQARDDARHRARRRGRPQRAAAGDRPVRPLPPRPERVPADRHGATATSSSRATRPPNDGTRHLDRRTPCAPNHAFLDDIAHHAVPFGDHDGNPAHAAPGARPRRGRRRRADRPDDNNPATYDDELLDAHFITGDGRGNENIGLTAVHHVFHAEHNRLVDHVKDVVLERDGRRRVPQRVAEDAVAAIPADRSTLVWNGERLFQAARFATEMQYQHLVFEEFARKVQPQVNLFAGYDDRRSTRRSSPSSPTRVYRFGHSMLTETVARTNAGRHSRTTSACSRRSSTRSRSPTAARGGLTPSQAAGAIVRGMTRQRGNEIDEFVTDALRNNLLGLPLDLAAINMARARDTGVPSLNAARRKFYDDDEQLGARAVRELGGLRASASSTRSRWSTSSPPTARTPSITGATTLDGQARGGDAARARRRGRAGGPRVDFLNSDRAPGPTAPDGVTNTGLDDVDFWIGGLAEKQMPFGGLLGSTFNFVFETQMEKLQDGDRFYYLARTAGLNFLTQLEENSFAELVMRNTDAKHLPVRHLLAPDFTFELGKLGTDAGRSQDDPDDRRATSRRCSMRMPNGTVRFSGGEHVVIGGTDGRRHRCGPSDGDDTVWGDGGNDRIEGGAGNDALNGGDGDDIITDLFGDDNIKGGDGNDAINAGSGFDLILLRHRQRLRRRRRRTRRRPSAAAATTSSSPATPTTSCSATRATTGSRAATRPTCCRATTATRSRTDRIAGDDVIIGDGGNDDYDSEGGDDIMVTDPASSATRACSASTGSPTRATRSRRRPTWTSPACCRRTRTTSATASTWSRACRAGTSTTPSAATTRLGLRPTRSGQRAWRHADADRAIAGLQDLLGAGVTVVHRRQHHPRRRRQRPHRGPRRRRHHRRRPLAQRASSRRRIPTTPAPPSG